MSSTLIDAILGQRLMVVSLSVLLLVGGLYAFKALNIEAYPDPSAPTIEVIAQNPGWSAEEMERQITVPIETQLNGMPGLDHIRSISLFGLSDLKCYFKYETDYNFDRQEVLNRLQMVQLPPGVQPQLSPTSAVGEIYRYHLVGQGHSLMDLKVAQDWILERQFKQIPGVIDVVSFGGPTKEFHVDLDPNKLVAFNVSISQVMTAIANSNSNVGANYLELGVQSYNVRGIGLFRDAQDLANVAVAANRHAPADRGDGLGRPHPPGLPRRSAGLGGGRALVPALAALRFHPHGRPRRFGQSDLDGRDRFRHHRGCLGGHGREHRPSP